jgi:hypothetical protein
MENLNLLGEVATHFNIIRCVTEYPSLVAFLFRTLPSDCYKHSLQAWQCEIAKESILRKTM